MHPHTSYSQAFEYFREPMYIVSNIFLSLKMYPQIVKRSVYTTNASHRGMYAGGRRRSFA